jgi:hypothetical protein
MTNLNLNFEKYFCYLILNKTYYGPFQYKDIVDYPNFTKVYKGIDLSKRY